MKEPSTPSKPPTRDDTTKQYASLRRLNTAILLTIFFSICVVPPVIAYPPAKVFLFLYCLLILLVNIQIGHITRAMGRLQK